MIFIFTKIKYKQTKILSDSLINLEILDHIWWLIHEKKQEITYYLLLITYFFLLQKKTGFSLVIQQK